MPIISKILKIQRPEDCRGGLTVENIEKKLEGLDVVRWAIVEAEEDFLTLEVSYMN